MSDVQTEPTAWAWPFPAFVSLYVLGLVALAVGKNFVGVDVRGIFYLAGVTALVAAAAAGLFCLVAYYMVARAQPSGGWRPLWPLWILGHVLLAPIVAPIFALRLAEQRVYPVQG